MFSPVGNNSFVQVSGVQILDLYARPSKAEVKGKKRKRVDQGAIRRVKKRKSSHDPTPRPANSSFGLNAA
jgi:hypothetical protein